MQDEYVLSVPETPNTCQVQQSKSTPAKIIGPKDVILETPASANVLASIKNLDCKTLAGEIIGEAACFGTALSYSPRHHYELFAPPGAENKDSGIVDKRKSALSNPPWTAMGRPKGPNIQDQAAYSQHRSVSMQRAKQDSLLREIDTKDEMLSCQNALSSQAPLHPDSLQPEFSEVNVLESTKANKQQGENSQGLKKEVKLQDKASRHSPCNRRSSDLGKAEVIFEIDLGLDQMDVLDNPLPQKEENSGIRLPDGMADLPQTCEPLRQRVSPQAKHFEKKRDGQVCKPHSQRAAGQRLIEGSNGRHEVAQRQDKDSQNLDPCLRLQKQETACSDTLADCHPQDLEQRTQTCEAYQAAAQNNSKQELRVPLSGIVLGEEKAQKDLPQNNRPAAKPHIAASGSGFRRMNRVIPGPKKEVNNLYKKPSSTSLQSLLESSCKFT